MIRFRSKPTSLDMPFIWASWLKSFRISKYSGLLPRRTYFLAYKEAIERLLERPELKLIVAYDPDAEPGKGDVNGWIAAEPKVLHYVYVAEGCRRQGIARALMSMAGFDYPGQFVFTYKTPQWASFLHATGWSAIHDPWPAREPKKTQEPYKE